MKRNKKKILIVCICVVLALIVISLSIYIPYRKKEYNEEAVLETEFLPYPDAVTVYYNDNGKAKKERLSKKEIEQVFAAFDELKRHYVCANPMFVPSQLAPEWDEEEFIKQCKENGAVIFHYEQRRLFQAGVGPSNFEEYDGSLSSFGAFGEGDKIALVRHDKGSALRLVRIKNDEYHTSILKNFISTEFAAFWAAVNACVE